MTHYHTFEVSYPSATNTLQARVKIRSPRFKQSKIISYDFECRDIQEVAEKWLMQNNFNIIGGGESSTGYVIITDTFKPLQEVKQ